MTRHEIDRAIEELLLSPGKEALRMKFPPAAPEQIQHVRHRAEAELAVSLATEYLSLLEHINGGGYDICFYPTDNRTMKVLGRDRTALGIVEQNLRLRETAMLQTGEIAYAEGSGSYFLQTNDKWVARSLITKEVDKVFGSFRELLALVYG